MKLVDLKRLSVFNFHYTNYPLDYFLDCQSRLGIKTVELLGGRQGIYMDYRGVNNAEEVRRKLSAYGISCGVFSPDNCFYGYQSAVKEPELVERTYRYFVNGIHAAAEIGAGIMEIHPGWGYWNEPEEEAHKRSVDMLHRLAEEAERCQILLACESLRPEETQIGCKLEQMQRIDKEVDHPAFDLMIDMTAMSVAGETIDQWFAAFGAEKIIHAHFQDCDPYGHYIWGDGKRNLREDILAMERNGYCGLYSQEITDSQYYDDPFYHDQRNMQNLRRYFQ